MNTTFPFGFPTPTALYLTLYVVTLVVHVAFMNYVLAGSGYLAIVSLFTGGQGVQRQRGPLAAVLRDWMPFMLGAAITAGVAPLLFVQILYRREFYSANLLLFHRWMSILPALIVGFYLLYVLKSRVIGGWPVALRALVGAGAFVCFAFTAYSWTENHLLSLDARVWPEFYGSRQSFYVHAALPLRLGAWFVGAVPTMLAITAWQQFALRRSASSAAVADGERVRITSPRAMASYALIALFIAGGCAAAYWSVLTPAARNGVWGAAGRPYLIVAMIGAMASLAGWLMLALRNRLGVLPLALASAGTLATIAGMAVLREIIRIASVDFASLLDHHARAAEISGFPVFLAFFGINAILIAWCVRIALRRKHP